jgi:hypothetical protein
VGTPFIDPLGRIQFGGEIKRPFQTNRRGRLLRVSSSGRKEEHQNRTHKERCTEEVTERSGHAVPLACATAYPMGLMTNRKTNGASDIQYRTAVRGISRTMDEMPEAGMIGIVQGGESDPGQGQSQSGLGI